MKAGTCVKVIRSIDPSNPAKHIGEIGKVVHDADGKTVETMITVHFPSAILSAYWTEELQVVK